MNYKFYALCLVFPFVWHAVVLSGQTMSGYSMSNLKLSFWELLCKAQKQLVGFGGMLPQAVLWISDPLWSLSWGCFEFWHCCNIELRVLPTDSRQYQSQPAMASYQMVKCREHRRLCHILDKDNYTTMLIFEHLLPSRSTAPKAVGIVIL